MEELSADELRDKLVLVGIDYIGPDNQLIARRQLYGKVSQIDPRRGVCLRLMGQSDGTTFWLPPDLTDFHKAAPGHYRLASTGETVIDPDYLATWSVSAPAQEASEPQG